MLLVSSVPSKRPSQDAGSRYALNAERFPSETAANHELDSFGTVQTGESPQGFPGPVGRLIRPRAEVLEQPA